MKKLLIILIAALVSVSVLAQVPQKMSYQAVIRNSSNDLIISSPVGMQLSILQGSSTGATVYKETQTPVTNTNGLVSLEIGSGTVVMGNFSTIDWANGPYFIKTETDPAGGTSYGISGTSQLISVPYALYAASGNAGPAGPEGASGKTILNGTSDPSNTIGVNDDFYINTSSKMLFGPKNATWPAGISLTGPQGPQGDDGAFPQGSQFGEMNYWNGTDWISIPPGTIGQNLKYCHNGPTWGECPSVLTTTEITASAGTAAISGGNITYDGGNPITARGVCWGTSPNPTTANNTTTNGTGMGTFASNLSGLVVGTTYYVRAYATNSIGTSYGNELSFVQTQFYIGQSYQGGIIAHIDETGIHGLIAAPSDQSTGAMWGCFGTSISGADGDLIGTGNQNTIDIVNGCATPGIAAAICNDLILNGYSDWFLPSLYEFGRLYVNRVAIGNFSNINYYWSSTEYASEYAYAFHFQVGEIERFKNQSYYVRAVRYF